MIIDIKPIEITRQIFNVLQSHKNKTLVNDHLFSPLAPFLGEILPPFSLWLLVVICLQISPSIL